MELQSSIRTQESFLEVGQPGVNLEGKDDNEEPVRVLIRNMTRSHVCFRKIPAVQCENGWR